MSNTSPLSSPAPGRAAQPDRVGPVALSVIDREGTSGLTVENVAAELQIGPEALLQLLGDSSDPPADLTDLVVDVLFDDAVLRPAAAGWQEYLVRVADGIWRTALEHPVAWASIITAPPRARWLRTPLRTARCLESVLEALHRFGFSDAGGVSAYRSFCSFLVGHVYPGASGVIVLRGSEHSGPEWPRNAAEFPRLAAVQEELFVDRAADEFEEALECLLDRLSHDGPP